MLEAWAQPSMVAADCQIEPVKAHATGGDPEPPRRRRAVVGEGTRQTEKGRGRLQGSSRRDGAPSKRPNRVYYLGGHATSDGGGRSGSASDVGQAGRGGTGTATELYVDGAYVLAGSLQQAHAEGGELMGPAQASAARAGLDPAYRIEAFDASMGERRATCPAGNASLQCRQLTEQKSGQVKYCFEFGPPLPKLYGEEPVRAECPTPPHDRGRRFTRPLAATSSRPADPGV